MTEKPTILVAGGEQVKSHLAVQFPPEVCDFASAENMAIAMEKAPGVTAVVVDIALFGAKDLCIRLRSDPVTSQIPLIFVVNSSNDAVGVPVDASVPMANMEVLDQTLRLYCPALNMPDSPAPVPAVQAEPLQETETTEFFDDGVKTVVFRRPEAQPGEAMEWPPAPPQIEHEQDMVDFTQNYSGYMNSLMEALEDPTKLSPQEIKRLHEVSKTTMDDVEVLLGAIQTSINEALMAKDLVRMRVLSSAKNVIYEKRQTIRTLLSKKGARAAGPRTTSPMGSMAEVSPAPAPPEAAPEQSVRVTGPMATQPTAGEGSDPGSPPESPDGAPPRTRRSTREFGQPNGDGEMLSLTPSDKNARVTKSELTLAAEAREVAKKKERIALRKSRKHKKQPAPPKAVYGSAAKHTSKPGYGWVWACIVSLLVLVAGLTAYYQIKNRPPARVKPKVNNAVPVMKWVILQQSTAGITARINAEDKENDQISFSIRWFVNDKELPGQSTVRLRPSSYKPGGVVYIEVTPTDLYGRGLPMRSRALPIKLLDRK